MCVVLLAGCLQSASQHCADGRVCPTGTTCDIEHDLCLVEGQTEACDGLQDADPCTFAGQVGVCDGGVCIAMVCGNGLLEGLEVCDDGNTSSGDGCRADCRKIERSRQLA